jgi:hypothetical protein
VYARLGRYVDALCCLAESGGIFAELGNRRGQAAALTNLGAVHEAAGSPRPRAPQPGPARQVGGEEAGGKSCVCRGFATGSVTRQTVARLRARSMTSSVVRGLLGQCR